MTVHTETHRYQDGETILEGFLARNSETPQPAPAVLIAHAWGGRDDFVCQKARDLARLGYVGFALDMYGQGVQGQNTQENAQLMQPFMEDRARLQRRVLTALDTLKQIDGVDPDKIAAIGFCFGGLCVLDLARSGADLQGVVSFHGLLNPANHLKTTDIKARILVLHGHDDPMVPVDVVQALQTELTTAGADWQLHSYGSTVHAFTNPAAHDPDFGTVYNPVAERRSWRSMQNFLTEILN